MFVGEVEMVAENNHCWQWLSKGHWQTEGLRFASSFMVFQEVKHGLFRYQPIDLEIPQQYAKVVPTIPELHFRRDS